MSADSASALLRSLAFVLLFQAAGAVFFASIASGLLDRSAATVRKLQLWPSLLGIVVLLLHLALEPARLAGNYAGMLDPTLQGLVLGASGARTHAMQVIGLAAIAIGTVRTDRAFRWIAVAGAFMTAAGFLMTGHTSTNEWRAELAPFLLVHVLIVAFWFGSLLPIYAMLRLETGAVAAAALQRFSSKAVWLVPFIAVAGVRLLLTIANGLPDFRAPYGALMLAKVAGFALLVGLAAWNKVILVPAVVAGKPVARELLQWSILVEVLLLVAVLSVTAFMTSFYSP
jgi:putative copper resistance protein D